MAFRKFLGICGIFCFLIIQDLSAQNITLRGIVSDQQTGRPLDMANVTLQIVAGDSYKGTTTDGNGLYQLNNVKEGQYVFMVRYVGFKTYMDTLDITRDDQNIVKHVQLNQASEELDELTVSDSRQDDVAPGQISIRAEDFGRVPTPAGSADLVSYIQNQPGVVSTGDRGGQLFVRGGTPSENLVLMDGTLIFQPFHIVGFFSVFPEDVVSKADFYAGGFSTRYSGRTSAVLDVQLKNGDLYDKNWSASISPFVSDLFFESPVKEGKSSVMVSLRGSVIEESSKRYLSEEQPLRFNSQLIKYSSISGDGLSCSALFMRTYDRGQLDFEDGDFFKWNNLVTGGRCAGVSEESGVSFLDINFGLSRFSNRAANRQTPGRSSNIFRSHLDLNITQYVGEWRLDYGFLTNFNNTNYDISDLFISLQESNESFLSTGGYITVNIPLGEYISLDPGFSYTSFLNRFKSSLEPRFQLSWQPRGRVDEEIHAAFGIYRQPILGVTDYRDAGTAFTAWMPMPDSNRRMEARHALLGWRQPIGRLFDVSIEGYYKEIRDTPVAKWSTVAQFTTDLAFADGTVRGVDTRLNFDHRHVYFGIGYSYSITEYETAQDHFGTWFGEPVQRYNPPHDRRHQINAQTGLEIGNFTANISWIYGSGLPYTRPMGFDSYFSFEERPPDITGDYGDPRLLLNKPFDGRLPDFHRLDVSVTQAFELSTIGVELQAGAINAYDWKNLFYYDVFNQRGINQLPLMPYLSLKMGSL